MWVCLQASLYHSEVSQSKLEPSVCMCVKYKRMRDWVVPVYSGADVFLALIFRIANTLWELIHDAVIVYVCMRSFKTLNESKEHTFAVLLVHSAVHSAVHCATVVRNDFWFLLFRCRLFGYSVSVNECDSYRRSNKLKYCEISVDSFESLYTHSVCSMRSCCCYVYSYTMWFVIVVYYVLSCVVNWVWTLCIIYICSSIFLSVWLKAFRISIVLNVSFVGWLLDCARWKHIKTWS